jgi:hypothetical protein
VSVKLELEIVLDSKGAVQGVRTLNTEVDKLGQTSQKTDKSAGSLFGTILGSTAVIWATSKAMEALTSFVSNSTEKFLEGEKIQREFEFSLRQVGLVGEQNVKIFGGFADSLSAITTVCEMDIRSIMSLGLRMGIAGDQIQAATESAIGLSKAFSIDLESAMMMVAQATEGNFRGMQRYLPEIKTATTVSDKFAIAQKAMAAGLAMAKEEITSLGGQMAQAQNRMEDTQRKIGLLGAEFKNLTYKILEPCTDMLLVFIDTLRRVDEYQIKDSTARQFNENKEAFEAAAKAAGVLEQEQKKLFEQYANISTGQTGMEIYGNALDDLIVKYPEAARGYNEYFKVQQLGGIENNKLTISTEALTKSTKTLKDEIDDTTKTTADWEKQARLSFEEIDMLGGGLTQNAKDAEAAAEAANILANGYKIDTVAAGWLRENIDRLNSSSGKTTTNIITSWEEVTAIFEMVKNSMSAIDDMFAALGVNSTKVTSQISNALGAAIGFSKGLDSMGKEGATFTDKLTGVTSIIGAVSMALTVATSIIKLFAGDGIGEAITRENQWMGLNDKLKQQLKDLAKEMGNTHAATSVMLNEIIDQTDMSTESFDQWANRTREILADFDRYALTATETVNEMGDAFTSLIAKAQELGTEGSASLLIMFEDLANRGMEVAEVTKYINEQLKLGLEGYKDYLAGEFSSATIDVFENILAYEKKITLNQALIDGVHGITKAFVGLSNATRLTESEFDNFEMAARDAYATLLKQGFTEKESLIELAPMLSRMVFLQKEYGLEVDAATQALIDKAKAEGINLDKYKSQEDIFGEMADSLKDLVDIFKNVFPNAIDKSTEALERFNRQYPDSNAPYVPGQPNPKRPDEEPAAVGWQGWVTKPKRFLIGEGREPEYVSITPQSKMRGSDAAPGGRITNINISIKEANSPETAASNIITAYRGNIRGLRSLLEN